MKKLLILILALAVAVGGYFVVNLNWAALFQTTSTLTEDEARTLLLEAFGGEIVSMSHNDSATPYYVAELQVGKETIIAEVDAISSRITTKQVVKDESEAVEKPALPLTKESALELALAEFEGEAVDIILVERGGEQFYEVELQSDSEHALFSYNVATGKLVNHETTELSSNSVQSVASTIKGTTSNTSAASSIKDDATNNSANTVEKPTINQTEAPSTVALTIEQAEKIALGKVNGEVKSSTVSSENVFEFEIDQRGKLFVVKINATNGLVIETSSK